MTTTAVIDEATRVVLYVTTGPLASALLAHYTPVPQLED